MQRPVETDPKNPKKMDRVVGQLGLLKSKIVELIRTALIYGSSGIYRSGE
jgi:DNA-directed RNA polymerase subunit H (RpoH/RPB5)